MALFDQLRQWAYRAIRPYWGADSARRKDWLAHCEARALLINSAFPDPLHWGEVSQVVKSVSKWCSLHITKVGFSEWQSAQAKKEVQKRAQKAGIASGLKRRAGSTTETAPWEVLGMSRATWYRRQSGVILPNSEKP